MKKMQQKLHLLKLHLLTKPELVKKLQKQLL
jgi:hypothetical protein